MQLGVYFRWGVVEVAYITPFISHNAAAHIRWWNKTDPPPVRPSVIVKTLSKAQL